MMINKLWLLEGAGYNPYENLAMESVLLQRLQPGECYLYLWQNKHTVVLGRNQDILAECHVQELEKDGGFAARRLSGGGAVYHDLGNLNFTMIMNSEDFDVATQDRVILEAVASLGIKAELTGRNDLTVEGRKFSGHAYYHHGGHSYHHGTIMLDVDTGQLAKYLNVSPLKLKAKGVKSVQSRVCNLVEFKPDISVKEMKVALGKAFGQVYKLKPEKLVLTDADRLLWLEEQVKLSSPEWLYGTAKVLDNSKEARFEWGTIRLDYSLNEAGDKIADIQIWTDSLEAELFQQLPRLLKGCRLEEEKLLAVISMADGAGPKLAEDIIGMLIEEAR